MNCMISYTAGTENRTVNRKNLFNITINFNTVNAILNIFYLLLGKPLCEFVCK